MKKFGFLKLFSILTLAAAGAVAVGAASSKKAEAAEATVGSSGNVIIRKDDGDMKYAGSSLVAYLFNATQNAWIEPEANDGKTYQELSWSLDFVPETIIVLRVDSANWSVSNPWTNIWSRTGNVSLTDTQVIWMQGSAWDDNSNWGSFSCVATVKGGATDDWTDATVNQVLGHIKTDGDKIEVYDSVSFPANTYFKVVKGDDWYGNYTAHSSIEGNLSGGGSENIHITAAATYEVYFNFESPSVYLTDPVLAAADEWAQTFMGANCTATKTGWASAETAFNGLNGGAKNLIKTQAHVSHDASAEGYVAQAVQRYDYVLELYGIYDASENPQGYTDFLDRVENHYVVAGSLKNSVMFRFTGEESTNIVPIILIVSLASATALGGFFFIRKRKEN